MALADYYKKKREAVSEERERLAIERARNSTRKLMESQQFALSALSLPESEMAVDAIISNTVKTILDPSAEFIDTLRAKGYRQAEIHALVHNLYVTYFTPMDRSKADKLTYDEMLPAVADYVATHQEIYNTLDPEQLRG